MIRAYIFRLVVAAAAVILLLGAVYADEVTVSLAVASPPGAPQADARQEAWESPLGGWVAAAWPFDMRIDEIPVLSHRAASDKMMADPSSRMKDGADNDVGPLEDGTLGKKEALQTEDPLTLRIDRPSSAVLDLNGGRHVLYPFGIEFTVDRDGGVSTKDTRIRTDAKNSRLELICHPVTFRTVAEDGGTVPGRLAIACGNTPLTGGLEKLIGEFKGRNGAASGGSDILFRRLTLYLPPSQHGIPYTVNSIPFEIGGDGQVKLAADSSASCVEGREIRIRARVPARPQTQTLGVRWSGVAGSIEIACGSGSVSCGCPEGEGIMQIPLARPSQLKAGKETFSLPVADPRWPHASVFWDGKAAACLWVEMPPLAARPGTEWSCRITSFGVKGAPLPRTIPAKMAPLANSAPAEEVKLAAQEGGVYSGKLPAAEGAWRIITCADSGSFQEIPLGLVRTDLGGTKAVATLYTPDNRRLFRRGDTVELFWTVKAKDGMPAAELPILLNGNGLNIQIGKALFPGQMTADTCSGGSLRLDSSSLAPGTYEASVKAEGITAFPLLFRICQREPLTDFEIYSYVYGQARPVGGSPINAYYGAGDLASEPGLKPFIADVVSGLDTVLAGYADEAEGPSPEFFMRPPPDKAATMALASLGARTVPNIPSMLHHEEWNPKHSLPGELSTMRRRLALFTQSLTDVAGFSGLALNWYATLYGYWEESPPLDGHQAARNAAAKKWIADFTAERVAAEKEHGATAGRLDAVARQAAFEAASRVLPNAYRQYLADTRLIKPELTAHSGIPSFWLGGGHSYPPLAYASLTQRDSVDYTDYGISPWGNFRTPAFLAMGNPENQKTCCCYATSAGRASRIATCFGAVGRGLDGISLCLEDPFCGGEDGALLCILERFGSFFSALEPLKDVAVYYSSTDPWPSQKSVILHDLARMRRPGMLLSKEDVLAGGLKGYRVLFLAGIGEGEDPGLIKIFRAFGSGGGTILKDRTCAEGVPGNDIGFAYDKDQLHDGWGLAYPNGEWEFAHLWSNFKEKRERQLIKAFADVPRIPVTTPDADVVISPLAGNESICCFVINQTTVPLEVPGKWRQNTVLPRKGTLMVEEGWHVRDLLAGEPAELKKTPQGHVAEVDFTRLEGAVYLMTRREPKKAVIRTERIAQDTLRLCAWLEDADKVPLADPMPFEVVLRQRGGKKLFRKFAALGPERCLDVPVPVMPEGADLEIAVRDLVIGSTAVQTVVPGPAAAQPVLADPDFVGGSGPTAAFISDRKGPVTICLDERQAAFRPAAEQMAALLQSKGRQPRIVLLDSADIRPLHLRWKPSEEDRRIEESLGAAFAWRIDMNPWIKDKNKKILFDDPRCGYAEYGPRLRHDADIVLFGSPETHVALADLQPWLRRIPSASYPASGGFFIHHLWSPFQGGYEGVYIGCRDPAGAEAAVACLSNLAPTAARKPQAQMAAASSTTDGDAPVPPGNMLAGKFGTRILDADFTPDGKRLFVTTASYGDWLFSIGLDGKIQKHCSPPMPGSYPNWWRWVRGVRTIDDGTVHLGLWDAERIYSFEHGWSGQAAKPPTGFTGRFSVPVAASTSLPDAVRNRNFFGGPGRLCAVSTKGETIWRHYDATTRNSTDDLLYPRTLFPRAVSGDGRVLLASGFGIMHDCYGRGSAVNASVSGFDTDGGKLLWEQNGILLNQGKAIPLADRFLLVRDDGLVEVLNASDGRSLGFQKPISATDFILPVPGRDELLIVENNAFDRRGPAARAYLRPLGDGGDRRLDVPGRVTDATVSQDGKSFTLTTDRGRTIRFAADGSHLWEASTPGGGIVRISPDGRTVLVGARDGVLFLLDADNGNHRNAVDLNPFNTTTGEHFADQCLAKVEIPVLKNMSVPPDPPSPSYLDSLSSKDQLIGKNMIPTDRLRSVLRPGKQADDDPARPVAVGVMPPEASFTFKVDAGKTYLVELLAAAADPGKLTEDTRLEISLDCGRKTGNMPYVARLPLTRLFERKRAAFRSDSGGEVKMTLRAIRPRREPGGKDARPTYADAVAGEAGLLAADVLVAPLSFPGRNVIFDGGPSATSKPLGSIECEVKPWTGGNSTIRWQPYPCPKAALRLVDGVIANQDSAWSSEVKGDQVAWADARIRFSKPLSLAAIVIYEDNSGPAPTNKSVLELTSMRYAVYVHEVKNNRWHCVGQVSNNTNLVNIFACPPIDIDQIHYFWAGRNDAEKTDGFVRMCEIEAYSTEADALLNLDDMLDKP